MTLKPVPEKRPVLNVAQIPKRVSIVDKRLPVEDVLISAPRSRAGGAKEYSAAPFQRKLARVRSAIESGELRKVTVTALADYGVPSHGNAQKIIAILVDENLLIRLPTGRVSVNLAAVSWGASEKIKIHPSEIQVRNPKRKGMTYDEMLKRCEADRQGIKTLEGIQKACDCGQSTAEKLRADLIQQGGWRGQFPQQRVGG